MSLNAELCGVVCHDAGGADLLAAYMLEAKPRFVCSVSGPALEVFERRLGNFQNTNLDDLIRRCDWVLAGTGWQSDHEWMAINKAKAAGKNVICMLDNWVNYEARFFRDNVQALPDQIWVVDSYAYELASRAFPWTPVRQVRLPKMMDDFRLRVLGYEDVLSTPKKGSVLFLSDNTKEATKVLGDPGHEVADNYGFRLAFERRLRLDHYTPPVTIRSHPSEPVSSWLWAIREYGAEVELSEGRELEEDFAMHEIVVGGRSAALTYAVSCQKQVFSTYLTLGHKLPIPANGIGPLP